MSEGEIRILARLDKIDERLSDLEDLVFEGAALLRETIRMVRGLDYRIRNLERRVDAINGQNESTPA